jgi:hypothetical protein
VVLMTAVTEWGRGGSTCGSRAGVSRRGLVLRSSEACRVSCACFARAEMIVIDSGAVIEGRDGVVG